MHKLQKTSGVSLDNPTVRALAVEEPELFLQRYAPPVLIDEVQYAPELFAYIVDQAQYYESYLETYISRDIRDLTQVANETAFLNFMSIVAARTATTVNYTTLADEAGISSPTAKQWLSVLVSSGIVALIQPYYNNAVNYPPLTGCALSTQRALKWGLLDSTTTAWLS